jgi:hypothetical protein
MNVTNRLATKPAVTTGAKPVVKRISKSASYAITSGASQRACALGKPRPWIVLLNEPRCRALPKVAAANTAAKRMRATKLIAAIDPATVLTAEVVPSAVSYRQT